MYFLIIERLLVILGALIFSYIGYKLLEFGIDKGHLKLEIQKKFYSTLLSGIGPGIFFMAFGAIIIIVTLILLNRLLAPERYLLILSALCFSYLGFRLLKFGTEEGVAKLKSQTKFFTNVFSGIIPGVFFMAFGIIIFITMLISSRAFFGEDYFKVEQQIAALSPMDEEDELASLFPSPQDVEETINPDEDEVLRLLGIIDEEDTIEDSIAATSLDSIKNLNQFDNIYRKLEEASISFNTPETMKVAETRTIILYMSQKESIQQLSQTIESQVPERDKIVSDTVKISTTMEAYLAGNGFLIKAITPVKQIVRGFDKNIWKWEVKALETGESKLHLTLNALISDGEEKVQHTIETYGRDIFVYVTIGDRILNFVGGNWKWLFAAIISPSAIAIWRGFRNRKKKTK